MGYSAEGSGAIKFTNILTDKELNSIYDLMDTYYLDAGTTCDCGDGPNKHTCMEISFCDSHFHSEDLEECLDKLSKTAQIASAEIYCNGSDEAFWKYVWNHDEWQEVEGQIVFDDEKIYLFKSYCDDLAYGEEFTKIFRNKQDAVDELRQRVMKDYRMTLEEMRNDPEFQNDVIREDYISIQNDGGDTTFYIIEEHTVA